LVLFHHNPAHTDTDLDLLIADAVESERPSFGVAGGMESASFELAPSLSLA
jgi:phosphoribosyl 1,2-cyclic phosphodiesterase